MHRYVGPKDYIDHYFFFSVEALISGYVDPNPKPHSEKQQAHVRCLAYQLAPHATVLNGT